MKTIESFYDANVEKEWTRLDRHPLEFEITKRYLDQYITEMSNILDIGGGPGKYAFYLKSKGHTVCLADLALENINFARMKAQELQLELDDYRHANVLDLSYFEDERFDVVVCLGPLYHLVNCEDRVKAINECLRVLKPNGIIFIAFITKFAQAVSLMNKIPEQITDWAAYFDRVIVTGVNQGNVDLGFTDAFFFHPEEIESLMEQFPLRKRVISGIEGLFAQSEEKLKKFDKKVLDAWIEFSYKYASHPSVLGACQHILYIGNKYGCVSNIRY